MKRILLVCLSVLLTVGLVYAVDEMQLKQALEAYESGQQLTDAQYILLKDLRILGNNQPPAIDNMGGPDAFGYTWKDSEEPDGPTFAWVDHVSPTSVIGDMADDNYDGPYPIGFNFPYYGSDRTEFWVQSNGSISFYDGSISLSNQNMPTASYGAMIAWFWDDMDPADASDADVLYEMMTVDSQNACVISFLNYDEYPGNPDPALQESVTAQIILFEDGTVKLQYQTVEDGIDLTSCTIGIQNDAGDTGLAALYNASIADYPYDNLAIEFSNDAIPDASMSGYVYDAVTNAPIEGASVTLGGNNTTTDVTGFYEFLDLFSGNYPWEVTAAGYSPQSGDIDIVPGANPVDFYLEPFDPTADILIVDMDETPDSAPAVEGILNDLGYSTFYTNDFFLVPWEDYDCVFLFTGIYPNDFSINTGSAEETYIIDFLNAGGNLYFESGDNFGYTPPANLLAILPLAATADGSSDLANVVGEAELTGLDLNYLGENNYIDHLTPTDAATQILNNPADGFGCGVLNNDVALFSFEVGMLEDGLDWNRTDIIQLVLDYLCGGVEPDPFEVEVICYNDVIPPDGGELCFDVIVSNNTDTGYTANIWGRVLTPNDCIVGPFGVYCLYFEPGVTTFENVCVTVPPTAAPGDYQLDVMVGGLMQQYVAAMGSCMFMKEDGPVVSAIGTEWGFSGFKVAMDDLASSTGLPETYEMGSAYPNPFNPTANLTISLPEAAELNLTVFNVMGQQVAELAHGKFQAGVHSFVLDGRQLASGVYFIQAQVPGELNALQKVTLMK